jgi:predicted ATPase
VPAPLTDLIGREAEVAELRALLAERRLVTLTGVGGCGKTRLAIAVADEVEPRYANGVRFLDLVSVPDASLLPAAVAAALGVPEDPTGDPIPALARHLRPLRCLLVLDTSFAPVPRSWRCCWVRRYSAVRLFLDRAVASSVRDLTDADAPARAAVCAGLDGLPLAIELAAARTAVLTVTDIAARIYDPCCTARSIPRSRGATGCSTPRRRHGCGAWRCSPAVSRSRPPRRSGSAARAGRPSTPSPTW